MRTQIPPGKKKGFKAFFENAWKACFKKTETVINKEEEEDTTNFDVGGSVEKDYPSTSSGRAQDDRLVELEVEKLLCQPQLRMF